MLSNCSSYEIIGSCSLCGGDVQTFNGPWSGTMPPLPSCKSCGAHPKSSRKVIEMDPPYRRAHDIPQQQIPYHPSQWLVGPKCGVCGQPIYEGWGNGVNNAHRCGTANVVACSTLD